MNCSPPEITLKVFDADALKESQLLTFPFDAQIDAGTIKACDNLTEYIDINVVGTSEHFHYYAPYAYSSAGNIIMGTLDTVGNNLCYFFVPATAVGTYPVVQSSVSVLANGKYLHGSDIYITFNYFGEPGDYLKGTIAGTFLSDPGSGGGQFSYPLSGTFVVQRD
jgi:hypothetical protein